ncbi:hypothetical protein LZC95_35425 [Pendulispora brunnea]|uniref:Uncharacterized protein n=1 Tax=Pendulispora brunnea TaxID=2905690 RepID=A0ABZ2K3L8_9BACT
MMFTNSLKLGLVIVLGACSAGTEWRTGSPTKVSAADLDTGCALGVPGAHLDVEETQGGLTFVFTSRARVEELRTRVRHAAAMYGPESRQGLGHDGGHGHGGQHGLQAMQLPPARVVSVVDLEGGAGFLLVPVDAADKETLAIKSYSAAERMNTAACR